MKNKLIALALGMLALMAPVAKASGFDQENYPTIRFTTDSYLITNTTWMIDLNDSGISRVSMQTNFSTVTVPSVTVFDGGPSSGAFTVSSNTAMSPATSYIAITIASNTALAPTTAWITITITSNTALIGAKIYFNQSGTTWAFTEGKDWTCTHFSSQTSLPLAPDFSTDTAVSLANALNFSSYSITATTPNAQIPVYMSTNSAPMVVVRAIFPGPYANGWQITSSTQFALVVAYSTGSSFATSRPVGVATACAGNMVACSSPLAFMGGQPAQYLTITTTAQYRFIAGRDFAVDPFVFGSSQTALNLANAINVSSIGVVASTSLPGQYLLGGGATQYVTGADQSVTITTFPNVVILRAVKPGKYANAYMASSSSQAAMIVAQSSAMANARLWPGTSNFAEGRDAMILKIGSISVVSGSDFFTLGTASSTAFAIANAFTAKTGFSSLFLATGSASGVVRTTATFVTYIGTYSNNDTPALFTTSSNTVSIGSPTTGYLDGSSIGYFKSGYATSFDTTTFTVSAQNNFRTGLAVLFSTNVGFAPPGVTATSTGTYLRSGTTYFVSNRTQGSFQLSETSTGAFAGVIVPIATQAVTMTNVGSSMTITPVSLVVGFFNAANVNWQRSNDAANWFNVPGASLTINAATLTNSTTYFDLQQENARYIRETIAASSTTPVNILTTINGKR